MIGAPHEGGIPETILTWGIRLFRWQFGSYTDDTQMMLCVIREMLEDSHIDQDRLANRFADAHRYHRGYGPGTRRVLKEIANQQPWEDACFTYYPNGSFGNGGAMRAVPIGLYYRNETDIREAAYRQAEITHAHPIGKEGAFLIGLAVSKAMWNESEHEPGKMIQEMYSSICEDVLKSKWSKMTNFFQKPFDPARVVSKLGNGMTVPKSVPTAVYLAFKFLSNYQELMNSIIQIGGDVDTIAMMAGGIFGAYNGIDHIPDRHVQKLERQAEIKELAGKLSSLINEKENGRTHNIGD